MRIMISGFAFLTLLGGAGATMAEDGPKCGSAPESQWMSKEAIKAKFAVGGTEVRKVKVEDDCYEVYAVTKDGKKTEQVVNPVTGNVVGDEDGEDGEG